MSSSLDQLLQDPEFKKQFCIEGLVLEATEWIAGAMEEKGVSKAELAKRLNKSRPYITQLLNGRTNMTLKTLAEVAFALEAEIKLSASPLPLQPMPMAPTSSDPIRIDRRSQESRTGMGNASSRAPVEPAIERGARPGRLPRGEQAERPQPKRANAAKAGRRG